MSKIFLILFLSIFSLGFSQKKKKSKSKVVAEKETVIIYTLEEAQTSAEARIIAGFIKQNPGHEKNDELKRKLITIVMADNSIEAKPTIKPISKDKIEKIVSNSELNKGKAIASNSKTATHERSVSYASVGSSSKKSEPSAEAKKTAFYLSHLFNNDPNDKEAYINIRNKSKCRLIVKISGKKYYNLDVPASGQNFIMVEKGDYVLTTSVCDAKYSSLKKINKDIEIQLNVAE
ncbi:hypothetical protein NAL32_15870 [Chryseobacterium sp. Ch-15]|uniref:DUF6759 domain-containing protein n=1 Tax=Chryseobacterium muglaense TaxID=2893752 RepID=A0A9Q3UX50_9FLAO|nr:DUF6759 domain-containing protein [Chryseobacterium muglaense]MBD3904673.1 hypothetical protein [Chryseobacterium muglaense]MCC9035613.1 hypothetical protein [Chryseobacterium muglaense]MCM2555862.1 hypothetical protein [Chryseobacterium muglaense]